MYDLALFVHVLAAVGIFVGLAMEWLVLERWQSARDEVEVTSARRGLGMLMRLGAASMVLVLASGLYLTATSALWRSGWPIVGIAGLVVIGGLGGMFGAGRLTRGEAKGSAAAAAPARRSIVVRIWIAIGVIYLMTAHPGLWLSIGILVVAAVVGAVWSSVAGRGNAARA